MALALCIKHSCTKNTRHVRQFAMGNKKIQYMKVGDQLPNTVLYENTPSNTVKVHDLFKDTRGILFSVPGAFTPGCEQAHIPEFLANHDNFKAAGYEQIVCVSVNDPFVMSAWCKHTGATDKIRMLSDMKGELTKALHMDVDCTPLLGGMRSRRYSMLIDDNKVTDINMDPDAYGLACLLCIKRMSAKIHKEAHRTGGSLKS